VAAGAMGSGGSKSKRRVSANDNPNQRPSWITQALQNKDDDIMRLNKELEVMKEEEREYADANATYSRENELLAQQLSDAGELLGALTDKIEQYELAGFTINNGGEVLCPDGKAFAIPAAPVHAEPAAEGDDATQA